MEFTPKDGTETVEAKKLDPEWIKSKFPEEDLLVLIAKVTEMMKGILDYNSSADPVDTATLVEALTARIDELVQENAKLKAELKKLRRNKNGLRSGTSMQLGDNAQLVQRSPAKHSYHSHTIF